MTYNIHPDAPLDDQGNPVHPERGHYICGRGKSENTTETEHGRERDDVPYCLLAAGHGTTDPKRTGEPGVSCKYHGGSADNTGENNGNYKTGAYSKSDEAFRSTLTDEEKELFDDVREANADPETAVGPIKTLLSDLVVKYRRTGDPRFLREYRQLCAEFNIADNTDTIEHGGGIDVNGTISAMEEARRMIENRN